MLPPGLKGPGHHALVLPLHLLANRWRDAWDTTTSCLCVIVPGVHHSVFIVLTLN